MAFTSGYFSSLGMMYAPRVVPPRLSKFTGQASALALVGGMLISIYKTIIMNMKHHARPIADFIVHKMFELISNYNFSSD